MTNFSTLSYTWSFRAEHPRIGHYREYPHSRLEWYDDPPWRYDMFFRSYMWRHPIFPSFGNYQISGLHTYNDDDDYNDNNTLQYYWIRLSIIWRNIENEEGVISRERLGQLTRAHSRRRPALSTIKAPFSVVRLRELRLYFPQVPSQPQLVTVPLKEPFMPWFEYIGCTTQLNKQWSLSR